MTVTVLMTQSRIVRIDDTRPDRAIIDDAIEVLNSNGLVVAPTETRYGILAKIDSAEAVEKLFEAKGRENSKPSAIFVSDTTQIEKLADLDAPARIIAEKFLPGPLTLVLKSRKNLGAFFTQNNKTGFRISSSPVISELVAAVGPLTTTSANLSGQPEAETVAEIYEQLGDTINLYLEAGILNKAASTVVEVVDGKVTILRKGAISSDMIFTAVK